MNVASKHPAIAGCRASSTRRVPAIRSVLMLFTVLAGWCVGATATAVADPGPSGCTTDTAIPNELTMRCEPGAGEGEHAFLRCRDLVGVMHTHIGPAIGPGGGWSRAVCAPGENGPV
ncbi:hypothetical protein [Nocardia sp. NPDC052566]|uniref:hypothetical protein n=1 Tax=Nocardia sp. NPDC052566 TaxID=3364330 RepID=UPI0037CBA8F0